MSHSVPSVVSGRRSDDRGAVGRQDSSAADGPFNPSGLKVLVVDDDPMCLKVVSAMLQRCNYTVVTESNGHAALALLRKRQEEGTEQFDLVLSDVYMPDMDGFRLLEAIGLELDLPVIMMSSDGDTNVVLRGVTHGAVDFLIKPVRIEELRNVWQHVIRRRSVAISRNGDDSAADFDGDSRTHGTKRKGESESLRAEHDSVSGSKKPRVVWSVEMHQQFVNAVNILGLDKAVPKRILDLMSVEGLTRENVASHLQKYRLYLKRVEGVQGGGKGGRMPKLPAVEQQHVGGGTDTEEEMPQRPSLPSDRQLPAQNSAGSFQTPMPMHTQPMHLPMPVQPAAYPSHYIGMHQYQHQHPPMAAAHMAAAWQQQHQTTMHAMQAAAAAPAAGGVMHGSASPCMSGTPAMMGARTHHFAPPPASSYPVPHAGPGHATGQSMPLPSPQGQNYSYSNHVPPSFAAAGAPVVAALAAAAPPPHHAGSAHDFSALHTAQADHNNHANNAVGPDSGQANNSNAISSGCNDPALESVDALLPSLGGGGPLPEEEPLSESLLPDIGHGKQDNDHEFFDIFVHHSEAAPGP